MELAENLFSGTFSLRSQMALTFAIHNVGESSKNLMSGLQEMMSIIRILHALLQHFDKEVKNCEAMQKIESRGIIIIY